MSTPITIGADPEFFLKGRHNKRISAHDLVPGTKYEPFKVEKGAIQADGTAVEFNIDPASNAHEFAENIDTVLRRIRADLPKEYKFDFTPSIKYPKGYFETIPEGAKVLGCDPDYNAYTGEANPRPVPNKGHRTASGHIHIGFTKGADIFDKTHLEDCKLVVRRLDLYFKPFVDLWETDKDRQRRKLYGDWGCFRPKPYGVEYRVLGNSWLRYPNLHGWIFDHARAAVQSIYDGVTEAELRERIGMSPNDKLPHTLNFGWGVEIGEANDELDLCFTNAYHLPDNALDEDKTKWA